MMNRISLMSVVLGLVAALAYPAAQAQTIDDDIADLRAEIEEIRDDMTRVLHAVEQLRVEVASIRKQSDKRISDLHEQLKVVSSRSQTPSISHPSSKNDIDGQAADGVATTRPKILRLESAADILERIPNKYLPARLGDWQQGHTILVNEWLEENMIDVTIRSQAAWSHSGLASLRRVPQWDTPVSVDFKWAMPRSDRFRAAKMQKGRKVNITGTVSEIRFDFSRQFNGSVGIRLNEVNWSPSR